MKNIANLLTISRILLSAFLLICKPMTVSFLVSYLLCGLTDMLDGPIARKSGSAGSIGAKLDSMADLIFAAACLWKLLPLFHLQLYIWVWIASIAVIRIANLLRICTRGISHEVQHTASNRLSGMLLFLLPISLPWVSTDVSVIPVCAAATLATVQDSWLIWKQ